MDTLKNKRYETYDYKSRYSGTPYYYDTLGERDVYGIGANMLKNATFTSHEVTTNDTLEKLSLKYYANPTYWWVIAYFNDIQDPFIVLRDYFSIIKIPNIAAISFADPRY